MTPCVSVLVTSYNRERYLGSALQSILVSTFQDFEVIVVDDCSADNSLDIAKRFAAQDRRIKVFKNSENRGDYPNRMKAASLARGRYIKYVDSDDVIYPHSLAIMVDSMERYPDAALGMSHSMPEDESPYPWRLLPEDTYRKHFLGRGCLSCGPSGAIIRRDLFEAIGGFRTEWAVISDTDLWYRLAACWPTILLPPGLVWWRRHDDQEFTKDDNYIVYLQSGYELARDALSSSECPLWPEESDLGLTRNKQHFARRLISLAFRQGRLGQASQLLRESDLSFFELLKGLAPYQ